MLGQVKMLSRRSLLIALSASTVSPLLGSVSLAQEQPSATAKEQPQVMQVAKHYLNETVTDLQPDTGGTPMPFGTSAFMLPGVYTLGGQSWDCTQAGLYRFKIDSEPFFRNRIVAGSPLDLYALMSAMCWNHVHGSADETTNYQALSNKGMYQRWRLRCGVIVGLAVWLLPQLGQSAKLTKVTTTGPLTGYDDRHDVLETNHGGVFRMWDLTNGCYWTDANGVHLSAAQFIAHIANGGPMPTRVRLDGADKRWDAEAIPVGGGAILDMGLYGENVVSPATDPGGEAWLRRIFQAVV